MNSTTYRVLGIDMHRRTARRRLIVCVYALLLLLSALVLMLSIYRVRWAMVAFTYFVYVPVFISMFVFGGNGRFGLIKPFVNKLPRAQRPQSDMIRMHLAAEHADMPNLSLLNDERELHRRDLAHYHAYQPLSLVPVLLVVLSAWLLNTPHGLSPFVLVRILFTLGLLSTVMALTLPSAIILWTEPDIDAS